MRRAAVLLSAMAVVLFTAGILAQGKTDFSGKWAPDADKNPAPAAGGGGGGRGGGGFGGGPMTVTQDAKTLKIEREGRNGGAPTVTTYNLDGSDSKNPGRGGADQISNVKWDGAKLVITTKGQNGDQVQTWSMEGGDLVTERQGQNGPMKTYYKKQ